MINKGQPFPRLPLDGKFDLTYRCNNTCLHCWLWQPANASSIKEELSFLEIQRIVDQARAMGCQSWTISGGEPMLRQDFSEIFDYITRKSVYYKLNTNGTLITPEIAKLLTRRGRKMVALYGATAEIHDTVTRNPGSFEAAMRGFAYLKEAGAGYEVQIIPMRANYHQYDQMLELAKSLSQLYRVGAPWLWLSACGSKNRNDEIANQRLEPIDVIALDEPNPSPDPLMDDEAAGNTATDQQLMENRRDDHLFASCITNRRDFHIDPYGQMSFCYFVKDPNLRYDLRKGTFQQAWDEFIPSLSEVVCSDKEYKGNCGSCELRDDCRWCGVYAYLEHGRYSAKIEYLCQVAKQAKSYKAEWKTSHLRYYQIGGVTIQLSTDFPINKNTFDNKFEQFRVDGPGTDNIFLRLVSSLPKISNLKLGKVVYKKSPWMIYKQSNSWTYLGVLIEYEDEEPRCVALFNSDHSSGTIYDERINGNSKLESLTTFPTDTIILARVFADRQACFLHSSGFILDGKGFIFVGHSGAGKSTMIKMLRGHGEILCDERNILRLWPEGFRIHGTWSHGELPDVSPASAPLRAILYLEKDDHNELIPIIDNKDRLGRVLSYVIKPLATKDWWEKSLNLAGKIATEVPAYRLKFDKSGQVVDLLRTL